MQTIADRTIETADIDAAVAAGVISAEQRAGIVGLARDRRLAHGAADEEQFRLVTSFNDIFVTLAIVVLIGGIASVGGSLLDVRGERPPFGFALLAALIAAASWGLAEFFTRRRRMALPSITLLISFVTATAATVFLLGGIAAGAGFVNPGRALIGGLTAAAGLAGAAAAYLHWRRFHVPITVAAGAAALVGLMFGVVQATVADADRVSLLLASVAGVAVFALAMRFDMTDPRRETRRSDVAFWLHLLAAPLIVHPLMSWLGLFSAQPSPALAGVVIALYLVFTLVALVIDRRALLVSALGYVIYAISALLRDGDQADLQFPLTALVIGLFLVSLSAVWHRARGALLASAPPALTQRLPVVAAAH